MGRIIRPKEDGRSAKFFVMYVKGTSEDPELGAHEAFLNDMMDNAKSVQYLELSSQGHMNFMGMAL